MAVELDAVYRGTFVWPANQSSYTRSLTGDLGLPAQVDTTKTIDICIGTTDTGEPGRGMVNWQLTDGDTLQVWRDTASPNDTDVSYQFAVFTAGSSISVARGTHNWVSGISNNISMPAGLTVGDTMLFASQIRGGTAWDNNDWNRWYLTTPVSNEFTELFSGFEGSVGTGNAEIAWRVAVNDDLSVRYFDNENLQDEDDTVTVSPAIADLNRATIIVSNTSTTSADNRFDRGNAKSTITNTTTIFTERGLGNITVGSLNYSIQLIETPSTYKTEQIGFVLADGVTQVDLTPTVVDITKSLMWMNTGVGIGPGACETQASSGSIYRWGVIPTTPVAGQVRLTRGSSQGVSEGCMQFLEFPEAAPPTGFQPAWAAGRSRMVVQ